MNSIMENVLKDNKRDMLLKHFTNDKNVTINELNLQN